MPRGENQRVITVNQFVAGTLFGGQLVWSAAVLPTYRHLSNEEYLKTHTLLTWYGDALMPVLGLTTTMSGYLRYRRTGEPAALAGSLALTAASIAAARNLRINGRMRRRRAELAAVDGDVEMQRERRQWAVQHLIRSTGGLLAFTTFLRVAKGARGHQGRRGLRPTDLVAAAVLARSSREVAKHFAMMAGRGESGELREAMGLRPAA
jgi:hypothetical protein